MILENVIRDWRWKYKLSFIIDLNTLILWFKKSNSLNNYKLKASRTSTKIWHVSKNISVFITIHVKKPYIVPADSWNCVSQSNPSMWYFDEIDGKPQLDGSHLHLQLYGVSHHYTPGNQIVTTVITVFDAA